MSPPFSSILHCPFHHYCCLISYRHAFTLCVFLAHLYAHSFSTVHFLPSCFIVVTLRRSLGFQIFTCFNIWHSFVHKRLGCLPQTRPRADCCTSWDLVPALLQPYVGRFSFAFASRHARLALFLVAFRPDHVRTAARLTRGCLIFLPSFL
jgi:hypothetical protein